jgi:DNA mismatch endonuclease (patch repair protein)
MDHVSAKKRSDIMRQVRSRGSKPELIVRRLLHAMGYRYRLHTSRLPGKPDITFASRRKAILVHGCFWHSHAGCKKAGLPKTRSDFWQLKLETNKARDRRNIETLNGLGWGVLVVWQCELRDLDRTRNTLSVFLEN